MPTSPAKASSPFCDRDFATRVAAAPISWGVCEVPEWGTQLPAGRVLSEMASLGFTHTELGSAGWLPQEAGPLLDTLSAHNLSLLGSFVPLVLHDPAQGADARRRATETAELLAACGARYFVTAAVTSAGWEPRRPLSEEQWSHLQTMVGEIETICQDFGLTQTIHSHIGCVIETEHEIERVLETTTAKFVLDTGHLSVGGYDPLRFVCDHRDRVGLVHLKDTRFEIAARLTGGQLSLMEAVREGLFPPLGAGDLPLAEVIQALERSGYRDWYVIEQDCALTDGTPAEGSGPVVEVATSIKFLRDCTNGLWAQPA